MGRFISSDVITCTGQGLLGNNMFAYCANNPVSYEDSSGHAVDTVLDVLSFVTSLAEVATNPSDVWAWAGLAGDLVDVLIPFFGGVGEAVRIVDAAVEIADTVDDIHDTTKAINNVSEAQEIANDLLGGACFVAGTLIQAEDGSKPIEQVRENDFVWAWDEQTGDISLKRVVETYVNESSELIHIFVNGKEIICTPSHPFYSPVKGWTEAVHLHAGDILVMVNGEYVVIEKVQHEILEAPVTVFNFQVEDYHTYYVTDVGVLVHNMCAMGSFKKIDPKTFERANNLKEGTFHRVIKPAILKKVPPGYEVGRNPDILLNRAGQIAYQGAKNKIFYPTDLFMSDILGELM